MNTIKVMAAVGVALGLSACARMSAEIDTRMTAEGGGYRFTQFAAQPAETLAPARRSDHCFRVAGVGCVDQEGRIIRP